MGKDGGRVLCMRLLENVYRVRSIRNIIIYSDDSIIRECFKGWKQFCERANVLCEADVDSAAFRLGIGENDFWHILEPLWKLFFAQPENNAVFCCCLRDKRRQAGSYMWESGREGCERDNHLIRLGDKVAVCEGRGEREGGEQDGKRFFHGTNHTGQGN